MSPLLICCKYILSRSLFLFYLLVLLAIPDGILLVLVVNVRPYNIDSGHNGTLCYTHSWPQLRRPMSSHAAAMN